MNLALFVTDEQQRFGVEQRNEKLSLSFVNSDVDSVHSLVMSATPIPRTLAMVVYGDMDISIIRQKPAGRKEIKTTCFSDKNGIYKHISTLAKRGEQAYIVAPRIDDNDEMIAEKEIFAKVHEKLAKYGFILRYPDGKDAETGYSYEPWHFRYIDNQEIAKEIMDKGITLEEYLVANCDYPASPPADCCSPCGSGNPRGSCGSRTRRTRGCFRPPRRRSW